MKDIFQKIYKKVMKLWFLPTFCRYTLDLNQFYMQISFHRLNLRELSEY